MKKQIRNFVLDDDDRVARCDFLAPASPQTSDSPCVGILVALDSSGQPMVDFPGNSLGGLIARSTIDLDETHVGREVLLLFEKGISERPIIVGLIRQYEEDIRGSERPALRVVIDGHKIVLAAEQQITLQCGEASLTLTRAGKILVRGAYVLTESTGVNRIRGGSVQIN